MTTFCTTEAENEWLPDHCPPWCDRTHAQALVEGNSWAESQEHLHGGPGAGLDELRNPIDKRVVRPGGGGWNLEIRQRPMTESGGVLDEATVNLAVDSPNHTTAITLQLTSGEARTLARQLTDMADRIDL